MRTKVALMFLFAAVTTSQLAAQEEWTTLHSWEGQGITTTESFQIDDREWRVTWSASGGPSPDQGILQIMVYREEAMVTMAANHLGPGEGMSYVRGDPGRYYLSINSALIGWEVEVQVRR